MAAAGSEENGRGGAGAAQAGPAPRLERVGAVELELYEGGDGPPLLVLHGFLEIPRWRPYHALLAERYRLLCPSHPGFGGSPRHEAIDSVGDLAYLYLDLLDALGLERVSLLGQGLGGWIAAELAVRCAHRLARLVLVDAVGVRPREPVARAGGFVADWLVLEPEQLRPLAWHDPATAHQLELPADPNTSEADLAAIMRGREAATVYGWKPFFYNPRLPRWLHRVRVPTLVVWGEHDGIVPRAAAEIYARGIPGARLAIVEGTAHLPHLERPQELARLVAEFVGQG